MIEIEHLRQRPAILKSFTGLKLPEFEALREDLLPLYHQAYRQRLERDNRQRAIGGGRNLEMAPEQQFLLTLLWLRLYPTQEAGALWAWAIFLASVIPPPCAPSGAFCPSWRGPDLPV